MLIQALSITDYINLMEIVREVDYDLYIGIKLNVETGLALKEAVFLEKSDLRLHKKGEKRFYTLSIHRGVKNIRTSKKNPKKTEPRERVVVCNTLLSTELHDYILDERHFGKKRVLQPHKTDHDGFVIQVLNNWYRHYYRHRITGKTTTITKLLRKMKKENVNWEVLAEEYEKLIPFHAHQTLDNFLGGRHHHKYLIEAVCTPLGIFNDRQIEIHLGHVVSNRVDYGRVLNIDLMFNMVEETFVSSQDRDIEISQVASIKQRKIEAFL